MPRCPSARADEAADAEAARRGRPCSRPAPNGCPSPGRTERRTAALLALDRGAVDRWPPTSPSAPNRAPHRPCRLARRAGRRVLLPVVLADRDLEFRRLRRGAGDRPARDGLPAAVGARSCRPRGGVGGGGAGAGLRPCRASGWDAAAAPTTGRCPGSRSDALTRRAACYPEELWPSVPVEPHDQRVAGRAGRRRAGALRLIRADSGSRLRPVLPRPSERRRCSAPSLRGPGPAASAASR